MPPRIFGRALAYQDKAVSDFDAYLNEGRYEDMAIRDYDEAIRLIPKGNAAAFNNRALVLVSLRQYDRAIADYDEALRLEPNNGTYLKNRGNTFRSAGKYAPAIADFRKALALKLDEPARKQIEKALKDRCHGLRWRRPRQPLLAFRGLAMPDIRRTPGRTAATGTPVSWAA